MNKITTKDCVEFIVKNTVPGSNPNDWKRVSKMKVDSDIVRVFQNRKDSSLRVTVYENDGILISETVDSPVATKTSSLQRVYYVIVDLMGDGIALAVTDADYFDRYGCQSDHTPRIVFEEFNRMGLKAAELTESVVEFWTPVTAAELKAKLDTREVFKFSPKFHEFMKQGGGDWTVLDVNTPDGGENTGVVNPPVAGFNGISLVPLVPPVGQDVHWTGRCIFSFEESDEDELNFTCGPEEVGGSLDDSFDGGITPKLEAIFEDMDIQVQNAENYHTVDLNGKKLKEVREIVRTRLLAAGAVLYGSPMGVI